jgi:pyridoxamine 5'-phosphate oxidase family protein
LKTQKTEVKKGREGVYFTDEEVDFIGQSKLARVATSSAQNQPHVVPVAFEFDGTHFYFSGWNIRQSLKFRNIQGNGRVALVIDDLQSVRPWRPRGVVIRGRAQVEENENGVYVRVIPERKISWGLVRVTKGA